MYTEETYVIFCIKIIIKKVKRPVLQGMSIYILFLLNYIKTAYEYSEFSRQCLREESCRSQKLLIVVTVFNIKMLTQKIISICQLLWILLCPDDLGMESI
jgi:hypothetical protein